MAKNEERVRVIKECVRELRVINDRLTKYGLHSALEGSNYEGNIQVDFSINPHHFDLRSMSSQLADVTTWSDYRQPPHKIEAKTEILEVRFVNGEWVICDGKE